MKWDNYWWTAPITLPAWASFWDSPSPDNTDSVTNTNGTITLNVYTDDYEQQTLTSEQLAAYNYLLEHQEAIRDAILGKFFKAYPEWQIAYAYPEDKAEVCMPPLESPSDLRKIMSLDYIIIHSMAKDGIAYTGFGFECNWDVEHSAGAMMHRDQVIDMGFDEVAYLKWNAENDQIQ